MGLQQMKRDKDKIEITYDAVAKEYAEEFSTEHEKKPKDREMLARFALEIRGKRPVWDFGCGPGQTTKFLSDLGIEISGLDLSEGMVEQARTLYPDIHFQKGDLLNLAFESDSIAAVVSLYSIVHFTKEQVGTALGEIFRVLRPGGVFLFSYHIGTETIHIDSFLNHDVDIDFMFFTNEFIRGCLENCGFEGIEIIERPPYPDVEYQSRRAYVFACKPDSVDSR